jgi:2-polyprenyl-3-methyl-5-hydroxy-6-metoxy-1,4-benzoquinol methylase
MKECYICHKEGFEPVEGKVRDMPELKILRCSSCGLVFLENFDHIDDKFYNQSKMRENDLYKDWELHINECYTDDARRSELMRSAVVNKSILDFGCGGGGFLLKVKDIAASCAGVEKDDYFKDILNKRFRLKIFDDIDDCSEKFDFITMFHVLEHLKDPRLVIKKLSTRLNIGGSIIIEVPNAEDALLTLYKNKPFSQFTYWSCHLYLFSSVTLRKLLEDSGLKINYIKQIQRYPLSNHLSWLAQGKPGGHKRWDFLNNEILNSSYESILANLGIADTILASVTL